MVAAPAGAQKLQASSSAAASPAFREYMKAHKEPRHMKTVAHMVLRYKQAATAKRLSFPQNRAVFASGGIGADKVDPTPSQKGSQHCHSHVTIGRHHRFGNCTNWDTQR